jgi:hypothetical protein
MRRKNRSVPAKRRSPDVSWALLGASARRKRFIRSLVSKGHFQRIRRFSKTAPAAARVFLDFLGFMNLAEREK